MSTTQWQDNPTLKGGVVRRFSKKDTRMAYKHKKKKLNTLTKGTQNKPQWDPLHTHYRGQNSKDWH